MRSYDPDSEIYDFMAHFCVTVNVIASYHGLNFRSTTRPPELLWFFSVSRSEFGEVILKQVASFQILALLFVAIQFCISK
jgi:hypothetical protein